jgi:hypothetical protein
MDTTKFRTVCISIKLLEKINKIKKTLNKELGINKVSQTINHLVYFFEKHNK